MGTPFDALIQRAARAICATTNVARPKAHAMNADPRVFGCDPFASGGEDCGAGARAMMLRPEQRRQHPPKAIKGRRVPLDLHPQERAVPGREQEGAEIGRAGFIVRPKQANHLLEPLGLLGEHRAQPRAERVIVKGNLTRKIRNHAPAPPLSLSR